MLKCENLVLLEQKSRTIELPGLIDLGEGVAIGPADDQKSGPSPQQKDGPLSLKRLFPWCYIFGSL